MIKDKKQKFDPIVKTTDEKGKTHTFKLVEIVEIAKKEYGLFEYIDDDGKKIKTEEDELIVMRIKQKKGDYYFEVIKDENEFNSVLDYIDKYQDELEFE